MTPTLEQIAHEVLADADAEAFVLDLCAAAYLWDDIIDADVALDPGDVRRAFRTVLVTLPANAFYRKHFDQLHPLIDAAILSWLTANEFENAPTRAKLRIAYVIRSDYINIVLKCAQLLHGFDHAARFAPLLRAWWHVEGWDGYIKALRQQHNQGA